jgi:hypothetical protein
VAVSDTGGFRRTGSSGSGGWCTARVLRWARMADLRVAEDNWYDRADQWVVVLLLWRLFARLAGGDRQGKAKCSPGFPTATTIERCEADERLENVASESAGLAAPQTLAPSLRFLPPPAVTCAFDYTICAHAFFAVLLPWSSVSASTKPAVATPHCFCFCRAIVRVVM